MARQLEDFGDYPAVAYVRARGRRRTGMAYVRLNEVPTAGMADTGSPRSIVDREIAESVGAEPTGRRGVMRIAGRTLRGELQRLTIEAIDGPCAATIEAFVPVPGECFRKGMLLGMDFFRAAKMTIDGAHGEAFCPRRRRPARRPG